MEITSHLNGNLTKDFLVFYCLFQYRSFVLTTCRYKTANLNARNYYELLGVDRTATQKEIKKAFFKLSKEVYLIESNFNPCFVF